MMYLDGMAESKTLRREVAISGVGVHSGVKVNLTLKPSSSGRIVFRRIDLGGRQTGIDLRRVEARNSTAVLGDGFKVQTVEHLMASLYAFGIDSLDIEIDAGEIPIMDGSALPFVQALRQAGTESLDRKRPIVRIVKSVDVSENDSALSLEPGPDLRIFYAIDFPHPAIGSQALELAVTSEVFASAIAPARTFGFLKDVEELRKCGLALGGGLENAIILDDEKVINPPLRFPDEFVRHKILDLIGDFSLWGYPIAGRIRAVKAGHHLHGKALLYLLDHPDTWVLE